LFHDGNLFFYSNYCNQNKKVGKKILESEKLAFYFIK